MKAADEVGVVCSNKGVGRAEGAAAACAEVEVAVKGSGVGWYRGDAVVSE